MVIISNTHLPLLFPGRWAILKGNHSFSGGTILKHNDQFRSISAVTLLMLVGKLLSLLANQVYLSYFGADSEQLNIFSWALQIPNYLFQSLGTGLSSVVIPIFAGLTATGRKDEANRFGSNILCITAIVTAVLIAVGMVLSVFLPHLTDFSDKRYASMALQILMPVMFFYAMVNIHQGILQSMGHFLTPALVNLPSGIVILLYIAFFAGDFGVTGLLAAVVIGLFLQFAILPLPARRAGFRFRPVVDLRDSSIRTAGRMMWPVVLGSSAYQLNMLFNNMLMSSVAPEYVSLFSFVQSLILSSVMVLVLSITSVKYPALTALAAKSDMMAFREELCGTMGGMIYILTPITFGLICLRYPLLELISLYGKVSPENIRTEAAFLLMYCLCIVFLGLKEIADRALYSLRVTKVSGQVGVVILIVNSVLGYVLSTQTALGAYGIPLAYSLAVIVGTLILLNALRSKVLYFSGHLKATTVKSLAGSLVMSVCVFAVHRAMSGVLAGGSVWERAMLVLVPTAIGMAVYFFTTYLLKAIPIVELLRRNRQ